MNMLDKGCKTWSDQVRGEEEDLREELWML